MTSGRICAARASPTIAASSSWSARSTPRRRARAELAAIDTSSPSRGAIAKALAEAAVGFAKRARLYQAIAEADGAHEAKARSRS